MRTSHLVAPSLLPEDTEQLLVPDSAGVVRHEHGLRVARAAAAHGLVRWAGGAALRVPNRSLQARRERERAQSMEEAGQGKLAKGPKRPGQGMEGRERKKSQQLFRPFLQGLSRPRGDQSWEGTHVSWRTRKAIKEQKEKSKGTVTFFGPWADPYLQHAGHFVECELDAPEAPGGEGRKLGLGRWRLFLRRHPCVWSVLSHGGRVRRGVGGRILGLCAGDLGSFWFAL